jgi:protein-disulfide isomerase
VTSRPCVVIDSFSVGFHSFDKLFVAGKSRRDVPFFLELSFSRHRSDKDDKDSKVPAINGMIDSKVHLTDGILPQMRSHRIQRTQPARICCVLLSVLLLLAVPDVCAQATQSEPLAVVNGETISTEELNRALGAKLSQLEEQAYKLKRQELDALIAQRLLAQEAKKREISVAALSDAEVTAKVGLVTEKEIDDFYQQNKARIRGDEVEIRQKIRAFLQQQKLNARREEFVNSLRSQGKVVVHLKPPPVVRVEVAVEGAPVRGSAAAPVTLVEFSDFECLFCKQAQATLKQVLERYPGKVRLAYRDFPLDSIHPQARRAAEAARCANDQGRFWEYHDVLFAHPAKLSPDDLKQYAAQTGVDVAKFESCLSSGVHKVAVQRDLDEGTRLGVTGTPTFFINGRALTGVQSLEAFVRVIEEELANAAALRSGSH